MSDQEIEKAIEHRTEAFDRKIAGALFDFLGFLTTSETRYVFSASDEASPAVEALRKFAVKRGLSLDEAQVRGWHGSADPSDPAGAIDQHRALTFAALREANALRLPQFKNPHGELAHSMPDGSDWSPAEWLQAVIGEAGEYANFRKKFQRGDITAERFAVHAARELADVQTYLDILARRCLDLPGQPHPTGIDLGEATRAKFNEVSERVGSDVYIDNDGGVYRAA